MPETIVGLLIFLDGAQVLNLLMYQIGRLATFEVTNVETIKIPSTGLIASSLSPEAFVDL